MSNIVNHHIATYHILHNLFIINPPRAAHGQRENQLKFLFSHFFVVPQKVL